MGKRGCFATGSAKSRFSLIDYDKILNSRQLEAVTTFSGPVLVIAGAGSGKTRTLVYRVARLIESGVPPESILLLTFTCRSAREMLERASRLISETCQRVVGGTFHSIANHMLRRFSRHIGFPASFTILDRADSADAVDLLRLGLGLGDKDKHFPKKSTIIEIFSKAANKSIHVEQAVDEEFPHLLKHVDALVSLSQLYKDYKNRHFLMDYDDLLIRWRALLQERADIRDMISRRFQYIMVDEYQDTNTIQADIVRLMAATHENVMVVGDDSQSIYSFRGADFKNIMDFPNRFPGARIIKLEENYRSTQPILSVANSLIARAREKYTKCLFTRRPGGVRVRLVAVQDEGAQSRFVCEQIRALESEGVPLSDIAVLVRAGFYSFDLELALARNSIPFTKYGGVKLVETAHIKDVLAHLRVVVNPADPLSWHRILLLVDSIGHKTCSRIMEWLRETGWSLSRLGEYPIGARGAAGLANLCRALEEVGGQDSCPPRCLERVLNYYEPTLKQRYHDDYPRRIRDLEQLSILSAKYESLQTFLTDMVLEPPETNTQNLPDSSADREKIVVSTIHSAKGLEWHTVFVISLIEGRFPSSHAYVSEEAMEEERRLMYVAVTRAKEDLFLTYPASIYVPKDGLTMTRPSRFLTDIPCSMLEGVKEDPAQSERSEGIRAPIASSCEQAGVDPGKNEGELRVGERVRHDVFGAGWIKSLLGEEKVAVEFDRFGMKTLHLGYARLSVLRP